MHRYASLFRHIPRINSKVIPICKRLVLDYHLTSPSSSSSSIPSSASSSSASTIAPAKPPSTRKRRRVCSTAAAATIIMPLVPFRLAHGRGIIVIRVEFGGVATHYVLMGREMVVCRVRSSLGGKRMIDVSIALGETKRFEGVFDGVVC